MPTPSTFSRKMDAQLTAIARTASGIGDLELHARNSGDLDFHELAAWTIREMLEQAYLLGAREGALGGQWTVDQAQAAILPSAN